MPRARRAGIAAVALAALLALTGCMPSFLEPREAGLRRPPARTSPRTSGRSTRRCSSGSACGDEHAAAPPRRRRSTGSDPATARSSSRSCGTSPRGDRIGSLLVNPGGPGGSGYDFIADSLDYAVGEPLQGALRRRRLRPARRRPVVGGRLLRRGADGRVPLRHRAGRARQRRVDRARSARPPRTSARPAATSTGDLLAQVDTVSAARDLDLLRAVLGDEQLNYLGYSYGTFLGATYADLYPEQGRPARARRRDRPLGRATSRSPRPRPSASSRRSRAYLEDCLAGHRLPVRRHGRRRRWTRSAACSPRSTRARCAAPTAAWSAPTRSFTAIIYPLYSPESWPYLSEMFESVMFGEADLALVLRRRLLRPQRRRHLPRQLHRGVPRDQLPRLHLPGRRRRHAREGRGDRRGGPDHRAVLRLRRPRLRQLAVPERPRASGDPRRRAPRRSSSSAPRATRRRRTSGRSRSPTSSTAACSSRYEGEGHTAYNKSNACVTTPSRDSSSTARFPRADPKC